MPTWWVIDAWEVSPVLLGSWVFWVLFSITLHELGHGWAAMRVGDQTPRLTGHMTWNPLVHLGPVSLLLFALLGLCWGAMPVDPSRFRGKHADAKVSFAGPMMNFSLLVVCVLGYAIWMDHGAAWLGPENQVLLNTATFLQMGGAANLALGCLNLLPIPPLDGSRILASFSPRYSNMADSEQAVVIGLFLVMLFFVADTGGIWDLAFGGFHALVDLVWSIT